MPLLHWSPRSPFVRKVMVALHEKGLAEQIQCIRTGVDPLIPHDAFMNVNPLSKIPTLELEDGQIFFDSHVICRWADNTGKSKTVLFPDHLIAERDEALADGLMEIAVQLLVESRLRPAELRSGAVIDAYSRKIDRALSWIESRVDALAERPIDIGHLSIGVALCYLDFRFAQEDWRGGRPKLAAWHEIFCKRPSVLATQFYDDPRPA
ncbi:MAG: glutathione S-transferase family protein [Rhizobiaceae bacterium]|nr:glutathione S-transferase family protein [Rhizobiaceae bacterium]